MSEAMHNKLQSSRAAIDTIDRRIVAKLNQRVQCDGGYTEKQVLAKVASVNLGPLPNASVQAIYNALMLAGLAPGAQSADPEWVDVLDQEIVSLLNQRVEQAREIGRIKHINGADYYDPAREAEIMFRIAGLNPGPIENTTLQSIYREVISSSIALEKKLVITFLGPEVTYTHQAALRNFGVSLDYRPEKTISDVFSAVEAGVADYGVIPIENSTEGVVFHSMDRLVESELHICSQIYLRIEHCLVSKSPLGKIREVHSKGQALGQCRKWLHQNLHGVPQMDVVSTAAAVRTASEKAGVAAIASSLSAQHYGVKIQARAIQDCDDNVTRFLVIGKTRAKPIGEARDKTSLVISLKDEVGALEKALHAFASRGINLSKIESRPSRKKAWDYLFFIDCIGYYEEAPMQAALKELETHCSFVKWLGSYPNIPNVASTIS